MLNLVPRVGVVLLLVVPALQAWGTQADDSLGAPGGIFAAADGQVIYIADGDGDRILAVDPVSGERALVSGEDGLAPRLSGVQDLLQSASGELVVANLTDRLIGVDPESGGRRIVSGGPVGTGPLLEGPRGLVEDAAGILIVADAVGARIVRVDPQTGERTEISGPGVGVGVPFQEPVDVLIEPSGSLLVVDAGRDVVYRVNRSTGDRGILSGAGIGTGRPFDELTSLAPTSSGAIAVLDAGLATVVLVNPGTGARFLLRPEDAPGPWLLSPAYVTAAPDGMLLVSDPALEAVFRLDPQAGERSVLSSNPPPQPYAQVLGVAQDSSGMLYIADDGVDAIFRVDPVTGEVLAISTNVSAGGPPLRSPRDLLIDAFGNLLLVDNEREEVLRVEPTSGERSIVSGVAERVGSGFIMRQPDDIAVAGDGTLIVIGGPRDQLLRIDPVTGDRSFFAGGFNSPVSVAVEADGSVLVADIAFATIYRLDRNGDNLQVVSGLTVGSGRPFGLPRDIALGADGTIYVVDSEPNRLGVFAVDPVTGDREVVSSARLGVGDGERFRNPIALLVEPGGSLIVADETDTLGGLFRVDPVTGDRFLFSPREVALSVDFESGEAEFINFGGGVSEVVPNPFPDADNPSAFTGETQKFFGETFGGSTLVLSNPIPLTDGAFFRMKVRAARRVDVLFKLEVITAERTATYQGTGGWEELCFDFDGVTGDGVNITLLFDLGVVGDADNDPTNWTFQFDDIEQSDRACGEA